MYDTLFNKKTCFYHASSRFNLFSIIEKHFQHGTLLSTEKMVFINEAFFSMEKLIFLQENITDSGPLQ